MLFMLLHTTNRENEAGLRPSAELIAAVGGMVGEMSRAGVLRDAAGLRASSLGVRVAISGGERKLSPGPFTGGNELPAALVVMRVRSREEAVEWASRLAGGLGDVEIEVRPLTEPWDLGFGQKPQGDPTTRFMAVLKADRRSEAGELPGTAQRAELGAILEEMKRAGVYLSGAVLQPSALSKRLVARSAAHLVLDGPFAESKELIAGFVLLELPSLAEAMTWARRYVGCLGDTTLDVRPVYGADDGESRKAEMTGRP